MEDRLGGYFSFLISRCEVDRNGRERKGMEDRLFVTLADFGFLGSALR